MDRRGSLRDFFGTALLRKHVLSLFRPPAGAPARRVQPQRGFLAQGNVQDRCRVAERYLLLLEKIMIVHVCNVLWTYPTTIPALCGQSWMRSSFHG